MLKAFEGNVGCRTLAQRNMMNAIYLIVGGLMVLGISAQDSANTDSCQDKVDCHLYGQDVCTDTQYYTWVLEYCPKYCSKCPKTQQAGVGRFMDKTPPVTCKDTIDNCASFGKHICQDVKFYSWVEANCQKTCNRCAKTCADKITNCADYGDDLCTNLAYYNWVQLNCPRYCARCSG